MVTAAAAGETLIASAAVASHAAKMMRRLGCPIQTPSPGSVDKLPQRVEPVKAVPGLVAERELGVLGHHLRLAL